MSVIGSNPQRRRDERAKRFEQAAHNFPETGLQDRVMPKPVEFIVIRLGCKVCGNRPHDHNDRACKSPVWNVRFIPK